MYLILYNYTYYIIYFMGKTVVFGEDAPFNRLPRLEVDLRWTPPETPRPCAPVCPSAPLHMCSRSPLGALQVPQGGDATWCCKPW